MLFERRGRTARIDTTVPLQLLRPPFRLMKLCFFNSRSEELQTKDRGDGGGARGGESTDRIVIHCLKAIAESASVELEGMK